MVDYSLHLSSNLKLCFALCTQSHDFGKEPGRGQIVRSHHQSCLTKPYRVGLTAGRVVPPSFPSQNSQHIPNHHIPAGKSQTPCHSVLAAITQKIPHHSHQRTLCRRDQPE